METRQMGLDNIAVHWPRLDRFYHPVAPAEFVDFAELAEDLATDQPRQAGPAVALAEHVAKTGTVRVTGYTELVDLLFGLQGVLFATDAAAEDEDPVISPDDCAWLAGGLERFVQGHRNVSPDWDEVTFDSVSEVLRSALAGSRLAEQQLRWLQARLDALRNESGEPPQWSFALAELDVLAKFYRRCANRGFAVYAEF
jgi:hypothetical protein